MKHDELRSIGHNIADSLACGNGFLIGVYNTDIFAEAQKHREGRITVDFIKGTAEPECTDASLAKAIALYRTGLKNLCEKHGILLSSLCELKAQYSGSARVRRVRVIITDVKGRTSHDDYTGLPLKRIKSLDGLGRVRTRYNTAK